MDDLVKDLYEAIPEFHEINDPVFDDFSATVYGCFGLFLEDVVQYYTNGKISTRNYSIANGNLEDKLEKDNLELLIQKSFRFMELKYEEGDAYVRDIINSGFFRIVFTSPVLHKQANTFLSFSLYERLNNIYTK